MRLPARAARLTAAIAAIVAVAALAGCGGDGGDRAADTGNVPAGPSANTAPPTVPRTAAPTVTTVPTTVAPSFSATVVPVTAAELGASWHDGCPVGPEQLRRVTLTYWDFDGQVQTGALVVHADVVDGVQAAFGRLFDARFPIRRMETIDRYGGSDDASMAADNTSAFNCRTAVASGPPQWSAHAYGRAIDVNPIENPYVFGGGVLPPEGAAFADRSDVRPGMAVAGGPLVEAFAASGWQWGGRWSGSPDYQHFSADGR